MDDPSTPGTNGTACHGMTQAAIGRDARASGRDQAARTRRLKLPCARLLRRWRRGQRDVSQAAWLIGDARQAFSAGDKSRPCRGRIAGDPAALRGEHLGLVRSRPAMRAIAFVLLPRRLTRVHWRRHSRRASGRSRGAALRFERPRSRRAHGRGFVGTCWALDGPSGTSALGRQPTGAAARGWVRRRRQTRSRDARVGSEGGDRAPRRVQTP